MPLIVSNDWDTVLRHVKDDKAYQLQHMSTAAAGSKKRSKRKHVDSNVTQKPDDEDANATPQPIARPAHDGIHLSPQPRKTIQVAHDEHDTSLDSMSILQVPQRKQDIRVTGRLPPVHMSHEQDDLGNYIIVGAHDQAPSQRNILYQMNDSDDYPDNYPGGYVPASEDYYAGGYAPTLDEYHYPQSEYMPEGNHPLYRKPLGAIATPQVVARPSSPIRNTSKLKTQLAAEAHTQPVAYHGEVLHHARGRVNPSVFYKQPWLLHLYMRLGCSPIRVICPAGL